MKLAVIFRVLSTSHDQWFELFQQSFRGKIMAIIVFLKDCTHLTDLGQAI